ncbi:glycoprotease M22 family domain-containing protein [Candidatus Uzinura diaspidicola str. ASNER]|uniref:Glycoprotease M22 family domain-containing protein n=1 Tax=Candidatus Uzinura diaspidicola str. ASNER TaxID=1133592 RepID=L7VMQ5_9FLAO|nr:glycoprotease M22 family domain-containing protein [Candidatus Uzinura diaspidicola str. ASNER]
MGIILNIETSTKNCSISLAKNGLPFLVVEENSEYYSHAEKIHCFISSAIEASLLKVSELNAISVSKGPGSYTGLKIGLAVAKGLCYSLNIPLLSIDTLSIMIEGIHIEKGLIIPMIDARFKEVYISIYNENKVRLTPIQAINIKNNSFQEYAKHKIYLLGNVAKKAKNIIKTQVDFYSEIYPSSQLMAFLSEKYYKNKIYENMETFEPLYTLN